MEEDVYDFYSLSRRLNMMEAENKLLKKKIQNLEYENLSLKSTLMKKLKPSTWNKKIK